MKYLRIIFMLVLINVFSALFASAAVDGDSWWNIESLSTEGTEFYVTFMKNIGKEIKDDDFFTSIYATAHENAIVTLKGVFTPLDGSTPREWIETFVVTADGVNNLIIPHEVAYMEVGGKTSDDVQVKGVMVTSDKPISVYISNSNIDSYDAAVIYPIKALYKEYVIQTYSTDQQANEFALVSAKNDNNISINIQETFYKLSGEVDKITHDTINVVLDQGESYLYRTDKGRVSLTGTTICSTEPLAVYQGGQLSKISSTGSSSHICTQSIPTDAWGRKYIVTQTKGNSKDVIRITAAEENTKVYKNNEETPVAVLQPLETYEEFIDWSIHTSGSVVYTSSRAVECYLYQTDDDHGAPTFTDLTPLESSIHRTLFTTFKYRYDEETEEELQNFVNIVVPTYGVESVQLDGNFIPKEQFKKVNTKIDGVEYSYAQLSVSTGSHILHSATPFIAHVYGVANLSIGNITYSYSAGRNILHPAWILIDGKRVNQKAICEGDPPITFTSVINYDYTNVRWEFHSLQGKIYDKTITQTVRGDSVISRQYIDVEGDSTTSVHIDSVYMIVDRTTPICGYTITDTIKAAIIVNDTFALQDRQDVCYGDTMTLHYKGTEVKIPADTLHSYKYGNKWFKFQLNDSISFVDSLKTNNSCDTCLHCDSIINQVRIIRPIYNYTVQDSICVNHLPYRTTLYDTQDFVSGKEIVIDLSNEDKDKLIGRQIGKYIKPLPIDTTIFLQTIYGCDSVINLHLEVLPIYSIPEYREVCKDSLNSYEWDGHTDEHGHPLPGHKIYRKEENGNLVRLLPSDVIPMYPLQTYVYYDSLQTHGCKICDDAPGCDSVHILTLKIKDQLKKVERRTLCDNESFVWRDSLYVGVNYNKEIPYPYSDNGKWRRLLTDKLLEIVIPSTDAGVCDSICTMIVEWCPTFNPKTKEIHICENETYEYTPRYPETHPHDKIYSWTCSVNADGTKNVDIYNLIDTVETINKCNGNRGCDSIVHHIVYVHPTYLDTISVTECQSHTSTYKWTEITETSIWDEQNKKYISPNDIPLNEAGDFIYVDSTKTKTCTDCRNGKGCDSVIVLKLHVNPIFDTIESKPLCENDTLHWRGKTYVGGKAADAIAAGATKRYWATPIPNPTDAEDTYRLPKTYEEIDHKWNGNKYTDSIHFTTKDGCDSIYWLELTVYPSYEIHDTLHVCDNKSIDWEGEIYAGSKFEGAADYKYATSDNWYTDTRSFQIGNACDSVRILHLKVHPSYDSVYVDSVCQDYPYVWDKHMNRILYDSIQQRDIFFSDSIPTIEPGWHTYVDNLSTTTCAECEDGSCDSIWILRLYVKPTAVHTEYITICPEQLPYPYGSNGKFATQAGTYLDTIHRSYDDGCDSVLVLHLHVNPITEVYDTLELCDDSSIEWHNRLYVGNKCTESIDVSQYDSVAFDLLADQVYTDSYVTTNQYGCNYYYYLTIQVNPTYDTLVVDSICINAMPYIWKPTDAKGHEYPRELTISDTTRLPVVLYDTVTLPTIHGCDSVVSLQLEVNPVYYFDTIVKISDQESYSWIKNGQDTTVYGNKCPGAVDGLVGCDSAYIFEDHQYTHKGCDSILVYRILVCPTDDEHTYDTICQYDPYEWEKHEGHLLYDQNGDTVRSIATDVFGDYVYVDSLKTVHDYDSIWTLHLHINPTYLVAEVDTFEICDVASYVFFGKEYNVNGEWRTGTYLTSTYQLDTVVPSIYGCDSAVTHIVHVHPTYYYEKTDTTCQYSDYAWYVNKYLPGGSIDTARTYVTGDITTSEGQTILSTSIPTDVIGSFTYVQHLHTSSGCDSVLTLHLHVNAITEVYDTLDLCDNDTLVWHDRLLVGNKCPYAIDTTQYDYVSSGLLGSNVYHYTYDTINELGCEKYYYLTLKVNFTHDTLETRSTCKDAMPYIWKPTDAIGYEYPRELTISDTTRLPVVLYDTVTLQTIHGCDSVVTLQLEVNPVYYFDTTVVISDRDSYTWIKNGRDTTVYGDKYPGVVDGLLGREEAYVFEDHQLSYKCCDSTLVYRIHVYPTYDEHAYDTICQYDPYEWEKHEGHLLYNQNGDTVRSIATDVFGDYVYVDSLKTIHDYDSIWTLHLHINPTYLVAEVDTFEICDVDPYVFFGKEYNANGEWRTGTYLTSTYQLDTVVPSIYGCDSAVTHIVHVHPTYYYEKTDTTCQYADYAWYINKYLPGGTIDTAETAVIGTILNESSQQYLPAEAIPTDVIGHFTYVQHLKTIDGCDSILTLHLHINAITEVYDTIDLCDNSSIEWHNRLFAGNKYTATIDPALYDSVASGLVGNNVYQATYLTTNKWGCDYFYYLTLRVHPTFDTLVVDSVCVDALPSYAWTPSDSHGNSYSLTYTVSDTISSSVLLYDTVTLETVYGCDSIVRLQLEVNPIRYFDTTVVISDQESYTWIKNGQDTTVYGSKYHGAVNGLAGREEAYVFEDHQLTHKGCDSTLVYRIHVYPTYDEHDSVSVCQYDPYEWDKHEGHLLYDQNGDTVRSIATDVFGDYIYVDSLKTIHNYDSIWTLHLHINPTYLTPEAVTEVTICDTEDYDFHGTKYNADGKWKTGKYQVGTYDLDTILPTINGCDSAVLHRVRVCPTYYYEKEDTTCQYADYAWYINKYLPGGITDTARTYVSGVITNSDSQSTLSSDLIPTDEIGRFTYVQRLSTVDGCDSVLILHLHINEITEEYDTLNLCDNDTVVWHNRLFVGNKYTPSIDTNQYDSVASGLLGDNVYHYTYVTTNEYGCDFFYYLTLNVNLTHESTDTILICGNDANPYQWHTTDRNGIHVMDIPFTPDTTINKDNKVPVVVSDSSIMLESQFGCDSLVHLHLIVQPTYLFVEYDTVCQLAGGTHEWINHDREIYSEDLQQRVSHISLDNDGEFVYVDSLKTNVCEYCPSTGCDSVYQLHLKVLPTYTLIDTVVKISDEETFVWHENGLVYGGASTREAYDVLVPTFYPDTFVTQVTYPTVPVGSYTCDSTRVLKIVVGKVMRDTTVDETCSNLEYAWMAKDRNGNDSVRMLISNPETKMYTDVYTTILGFDSIFYLDLTVHPAYVGIDSMTMYQSTCQYSDYKWIRENNNGHPKTLYNPDTKKWIDANEIPTDIPGNYTYIDSLTTEHGCDSVWTLHLRVDSTYLFSDTLSMCDDGYQIWENRLYVGSKCTDTNLPVCDTLIHVQPQWDYRDTVKLETKAGCDSIRTLSLNIHALYDTIAKKEICDAVNPYIWETKDSDGKIYTDTVYFTPSKMYIDSVTGVAKKDLIYITDKQRMLKSVYGCDSLVHLHLTVHPTYFFLTDTSICSNEYLEYRGHRFNKDTIYTEPWYTQNLECDSIYQLRLHIKPSYLFERRVDVCDNEIAYHKTPSGEEVLWRPGDYIPGKDEYIYLGYYTMEGCDSIFQYRVVVHPTYDSISTITMCSNGDSVKIHDGLWFKPKTTFYSIEDTVTSEYVFVSDTLCAEHICKNENNEETICCCDSIISAHITILPAYKHIDSVTICSNEKYDWQDTILYEPQGDTTITYFYQKSYTTKLGCDSIYEMNLTVHLAYDHDVFDTICSDEYYLFGDTLLNQTGEYMDTLRTIHDCDSIVHLYLTVYDTTVVETYDTICVTEKYYYFGKEYTEPGVYDTITLNDWGCKQYNYLHLAVIDTTVYNISIGDVLCADDEELWVEYEWISGRRLIEYSVFFDEFGHSQGFEDIIHAPLDPTLSYFAIPIPRGEDLPMPPRNGYFDSQQGVNSFINETKQNYPEPNRYTMRVVMHNGICGDSLQRKDTTISFWYPSWIHEQHWNDVIVLYRDTFNGGYQFSNYQWYQNGQPLPGATGEYLYLPEQLLMNQRGDCSNYYQVELTRLSDGYTTMTCPICPVLMKDTIVPQDTYFSVVPTLVPKANPVIHFLASHAGTYTITTLMGNTIVSGEFTPDANNYAGNVDLRDYISDTNTVLNVKLTLNTGETRTIKVIIGN